MGAAVALRDGHVSRLILQHCADRHHYMPWTTSETVQCWRSSKTAFASAANAHKPTRLLSSSSSSSSARRAAAVAVAQMVDSLEYRID